MNKTYWVEWIKAADIRALRTVAQTAAAAIGTTAVMSAIDWKMVVSTALVLGACRKWGRREKRNKGKDLPGSLRAGQVFVQKKKEKLSMRNFVRFWIPDIGVSSRVKKYQKEIFIISHCILRNTIQTNISTMI